MIPVDTAICSEIQQWVVQLSIEVLKRQSSHAAFANDPQDAFGCSHLAYLVVFGNHRHLSRFALRLAFPGSLVGRDPHDYYRDSVALALAGGRRSHIPFVRYVLARRRCPVRLLERIQYPPASPQELLDVEHNHIDMTRCRSQAFLPADVRFHPWILGFGQCSSHRIAQVLQSLSYNAFTELCFRGMLLSLLSFDAR